MNPDAIGELSSAPWLDGVKHLSISQGDIGDDGVMLLTEMSLPSLEHLDLHSAEMRAAGLERICLAPWATHLRMLRIHGNPLGDPGAAVLAETTAFAKLEHLNVDACGFTDAGYAALARSWLPALRLLEFSGCGCPSGAEALLQSVQLSFQLRQRLSRQWARSVNTGGAQQLELPDLLPGFRPAPPLTPTTAPSVWYRCQHCGVSYRVVDNGPDACRQHPGTYEVHDGGSTEDYVPSWGRWTCCDSYTNHEPGCTPSPHEH